MADEQVSVKITADASKVRPGVDIAKGEIAGIAPLLQQLNASMAAMTDQMKASFAGLSESIRGTKAEVAELEAQERKGFTGMIASVHEGVESFNKFKATLAAVAEVYMAFFMVEHIKTWAEHMGEAAEKVVHLGQTFGMSAAQVQQMQGMATATGISFDSLVRGMGILDKNTALASGSSSAMGKALQFVGVSANDGRGQMERMLQVADKFAGMADGPQKAALAMTLFGKSGKELIPFLDEGRQGLEQLIEKTKEYGAVNEGAIEKGARLAESLNEGKLAWLGMKNILMDGFAPLLNEIVDGFNGMVKAMVASYNSGGTVKIVFEGLVTLLQGLGEIIRSVGSGIAAMFATTGGEAVDWHKTIQVVVDGIVLAFKALIWVAVAVVDSLVMAFHAVAANVIEWKGTLQHAWDEVTGAIHVLGAEFQVFAKVAHDALTLNWSNIGADWTAGVESIRQAVNKSGQQIVADAKKNATDTAAEWAKAAAVNDNFTKWSATFFQYGTKAAETGIKSPGTKPGGDGPDLAHNPKEKDDLVQKLDDELTAKKLAWNLENDAHGTAIAFDLQVERDYWKNILDGTEMNAKDRAAVARKFDSAEQALNREKIGKQIEVFRTELDAAKGNTAEKLKIATEEQTYIGKMFGEKSKEYQAAEDQIVRITREGADQRRQITTEMAKAQQQLAVADISEVESAAKHRVAMGAETAAQLLAQQRTFEQQKLAIEQQAINQQLAVTNPQNDPVKYQQLLDQMARAYRAYQTKITQIDQQSQLQRTAIERNAITGTASLWGQNIAKMLTLQQGFATTVRSLYTGMVSVISGALGKVIEEWLAKQISAFAFKHAAQAADGVASVTSNAAIAASAAFASTAAIPVVGPELAPAAAAAALAATMSFAPMASAAGGWWEVPGDTVAAIHKSEMVLPAHLASPLRSMIQGGGAANNNAPPAANDSRGGDFHYHDHTGTLTHDQIMSNRSSIAKALKQAHRDGAFAGSPIRF